MKNNGVTFWTVDQLVESTNHCSRPIETEAGIKWVPARPMGWTDIPHRLRAMWLVWTGRADVVIWPGQP